MRLCPLESACHVASACDPEADQCTSPAAKDDGTACDNGQGCIDGSTCVAGVCEGGEALVCPPAGQCQEDGVCSTLTNECVFLAKNEGGECDDGDLCTETDTCTTGECLGTAKECAQGGPCSSESVCLADTGECSESTLLEDGTECDDGDLCTVDDLCEAGVCTGTPNPCDDGIPCTLDSCVGGQCSYDASADCVLGEAAVGGPMTGPVAYAGGQAMYVAAGGLYALTTDGNQVWMSADVGTITTPSPVLANTGAKVYVGDVDADGVARVVAASAADGSAQWTFVVPGECEPGADDPCRVVQPPTEATDGTVYASTQTAGLYAIDGDGAQVWHIKTAALATSVVLGANDSRYVGQGGLFRGVLAFGADSVERWLHETEADVHATPVVAGTWIYYLQGSSVGALTDLGGASPAFEWSVTIDEPLAATQPILDAGGRLIVASVTMVWAIDTSTCDSTVDACVKWSSSLVGTPGVGMTELSDGRLVVATDTALSFLSSQDGTSAFVLALPGAGPTAPTVLDGGALVVGGSDGSLRTISYKDGIGLGGGAWPVYQRQQTRNPLAL